MYLECSPKECEVVCLKENKYGEGVPVFCEGQIKEMVEGKVQCMFVGVNVKNQRPTFKFEGWSSLGRLKQHTTVEGFIDTCEHTIKTNRTKCERVAKTRLRKTSLSQDIVNCLSGKSPPL